jgi:AcrR family transcriptional regulator
VIAEASAGSIPEIPQGSRPGEVRASGGHAGHEACEHRTPGRPRSSKADQAILTATVGLLLETGYRGVTIEGVASRAGVAKTTIYRRWPSKAEMVVDAVKQLAQRTQVLADAGAQDGVAQALVAMVSGINRTHMAEVMTSLSIEMAHDAELAEAVRRGMVEPRRKAIHALLQRGIETGEVRPDVDFDVVGEMLGGPMLYRVLFTHEPIDEQIVRRTVETLMNGIGIGRARGTHQEEVSPAREAGAGA